MLFACGICHGHIQQSSLSLSCSGICDKHFHYQCVNLPEDLQKYFDLASGLSWKCPDCVRKCFCVDSESLNIFLQDKFNELVGSMKDVFNNLKIDLLKDVEKRKIAESTASISPVKFSDIVKNKSKPAVIIEPKDANQDSQKTKSDIASTINPVDSDIHISKVKSVKHGGILVGCSSIEDNSRFKKIAQEKLADSYVIKEVKGIHPRVKIVGLTHRYSSEELQDLFEHVVKVNSDIFNPNSVCNVVKIWPTKKKPNIFQAIFQIDKPTYDRLMAAGGFFVGYDFCNVYDALEINRCYKCNGFGHSSRVCTVKVCCPRCSEEHEVKDCSAANLKCINCVKAAKKSDTILDTGHAAWDTRCPTYLIALQQLRNNILSS